MEGTLKSGVCPKCGGEEVYWEPRDWSKILPSNFSVGLFGISSRPSVNNFVCGNCGYVEFYVIAENLERIKKGWGKVPKR